MSSEVIEYNAERKALMKNTIAQGASDPELDMFIEICKATGLNPFKREIWFIKTQGYTDKRGKQHEGRVQIMTGINGFYEIANGYPEFDGIERDYGPDLAVDVVDANGNLLKKIKAPEWVETRAYRKDRTRPTVSRVKWVEYAQDLASAYGKLSNWAQKPTVMLEKCADATALRKAFPQKLNGLYVEEEIRVLDPDDPEEAGREAQAAIEAEQRKNYLKQQAARLQAGEYHIEFGSQKGQALSKATNSVWLKNHLGKYKADLSPDAVEAIEKRIADLDRDYRRKQDPERQQTGAPEEESLTEGQMTEDGWTPSPEEMEEIRRKEAEAAK